MRFTRLVKFLCQSDKFFLFPTAIVAVSVFFTLTFFGIFYPNLPPRLPLLYSLSWGGTQLVAKQQFLILPAITLLIGLFNIFFAYQLHPKQEVLKRTLTLSAALVGVLNLITAFKILLIFL